MTARALRRLGLGLLVAAGSICGTMADGIAPGAIAAGPGDTQRRCLAELTRGTSPMIVCDYPVWMTEEERGELRRWTRNYVQDARCTVHIAIERALVTEAMSTPDTVFLAPPQPVDCTVTTTEKVYPVTGSFAPRVVFKDGVAVEATPGLANVKGVHAAIAWPVITFVNSSRLIGKGLVDAVNAYLRARRA